ncbi:dynein axonemal heavy chain 10 [Condylostylus longicornis]|uniref:dynein axonemal heavy chain 10 n=1 Tax=Condylostylus longicornis TaxID=2530218 RepID=UPI00244DC3B5|nr:dynein axonemal heavy chain 10 [Condylostylus longicornis]
MAEKKKQNRPLEENNKNHSLELETQILSQNNNRISIQIMDDFRIMWLKHILSNMTGVFDLNYTNAVFDENVDAFVRFLDVDYKRIQDIDCAVLYAWRTFYDKWIEKEITVLEEVPPPPPPPKEKKGKKGKDKKKGGGGEPPAEATAITSDGESGDDASFSDDDDDFVGKKGRKKQKKEKKKPEPIYIEVQKIIQVKIKEPLMHCHFGAMDPSAIDPNIKYIYLVRKYPHAIPKQNSVTEAFCELPRYFLYGTLEGNIFKNFKGLLDRYKIAIELKFREPKWIESKLLQGETEESTPPPQETATSANDMTKNTKSTDEVGLLELSRPSEFRSIAAKIQKKLEKLETKKAQLEALKKESESEKKSQSIYDEEDEAEMTSDKFHGSEYESEGRIIPKTTVDERWDKLIEDTHELVERKRYLREHGEIKMQPLQERIYRQLDIMCTETEWTLEHIVWEFTLPTTYSVIKLAVDGTEDEEIIKIDVKKADVYEYPLDVLENVVKNWMIHIKEIRKKLKDMELEEFTPMAEYKKWHNKELELYIILEQLKTNFVTSVLDILKEAKSPLFTQWNDFVNDVTIEYKLTRENSDYISTIIEYLKKIRSYNDFQFVFSLIPNLMVGLRHIWTMSSYYCRDDAMQVLLCQISYVFTDKVKGIVKLDRIFKRSAQQTYEMATNCANLLKTWKKSYLDSRKFIEETAGSRWEFDRAALFTEVDHIYKISKDIAYIGKVFLQFENLFSFRLKAIITDPSMVDELMKKVYHILDDIIVVDYDIFRPTNLADWDDTMSNFNKRVELMELEAQNVIDNCMATLHSSDKGLMFIQEVFNIDTRDVLTEHVKNKYENVSRFFLSEIAHITHEFTQNKKTPPLSIHEPPGVGAIKWSRLMSTKLKSSVIAFKKLENIPNLKNSYHRRNAFHEYLKLMNNMFAYEKEIFDTFIYKATYVVNSVLRNNLILIQICKPETLNEIAGNIDTPARKHLESDREDFRCKITRFTVMVTLVMWLTSLSGRVNYQIKRAYNYITEKEGQKHLTEKQKFRIKQCKLLIRAFEQEGLPAWRDMVGDSVLIEMEMHFQVNFSREIFDVMFEGQQFEHLGFQLPGALRTAIMRKQLLFEDFEAVTKIVDKYNSIIENLSLSEVDLLRDHLYEIEKAIQAGVGRYTWQSFNIKKFCNNISILLRKLSSVVTTINNIRMDIRSRIEQIQGFNLFEIDEPKEIKEKLSPNQIVGGENTDDGDYFIKLNKTRNEKSCRMKKCYESIGPVLIKLESLLLGTFTGRSQKMKEYYTFWESQAFTCILNLCNKNLENYIKLLAGDKPIFEVNAVLLSPEVVLSPSRAEVLNMMTQSGKDVLERVKIFTRWMNGTCLECLPMKDATKDNEKYNFTFYEDIIQLESITGLIKKIEVIAQRALKEASNYIQKFRNFRNLWMYDKITLCEKFINRGLPLIQIDEKFRFYSNIIQELNRSQTYSDVKCIRINLKPLTNCISEHALEWKNTLGEILAARNKQAMITLEEEFGVLRRNVDRSTKYLNDFKTVMSSAVKIQTTSLSVELKIKQMQETFNVLKEHEIKFNYSDMLMSYYLEKKWKRLFRSAIFRMGKLQPIKQKFANLTSVEISTFLTDLTNFIEDFEKNGPGSVGTDLDRGVKLMETYGQKFENIEARRYELASAEKLFDLPLTDYTDYLKCRADFDGMSHIFRLYKQQRLGRETWAKTLWIDLDPLVLTEGIEMYLKEFRKLPKPIRSLNVGQELELQMKQFKNTVPLMISLKSEALRERHWHLLMEKTGIHFDMRADRFTLQNMFQMELHRYQDVAEQILNNGNKELGIEKGVKEIEKIWAKMSFKVIKHFKANEDRGYTLAPVDEIIQVLEDNSMNLQSMATSQFVGPFLQTVLKWERCLALVYEVIDEWMACQRKWLYLEGIFIGGDIRTQLPEEAKKFDDIDKVYRRIMMECAKNQLIIPLCSDDGRLQELQNLSIGLDKCQKSLNEYLDSKRRIFPRFYFISTDELLSILGSSEPTAVQDHIIKMYDNIKSLKFVNDSMNLPTVIAMVSSEGETMELRNNVNATGRVEEWMNIVLEEMRKTNRFITKKAIYDYGKNLERARADWILLYQGMICLAGNGVWWTAEVEEVFEKIKKGNKRAMKEYLEKQNKQIEELVYKVRSNLSNNDRAKFKTITTVDVHARDIIETFVRDNILDAQAFSWESQLRFYWIKQFDNLYVVQCTGRFDYGYEYMGLNGRLVITPLTDRIYLTITQALLMNLGGAPAGPAGTGKTETTKDLAKAMALLCIVTNCGEGMDFLAFGTILAGIAQCGAWGCFDEFNRIDISVLSVISTQLQTIRSALIRKLKEFLFEGNMISLDSKVGVFITMNPGYAGRTELPESVKALFRPVTCIKPDLELICLISLFSDGFLTAKVLAKKMTVLYKLAQEQLSKQCHYDWGLRSLNSVLRMAGVAKRTSGDAPEAVVLMRVLRDMNFPKFVYEDVPLFLGLIKDLFPGVDCPRVDYPDFNAAVRHILNEDGYILLSEQEDKVVQMYEIMMTRHSTMLVGPTGGGKTVVMNTLVKAQCYMGLPTKCIVLNPKACSVIELYGYLNPDTRDWFDGLFSNIFRDMNKPIDKEERRYVCFDGDVDALWIENMNSVMDDNKLLTLANGERIRLESYCALLFEVGNLSYASPATVSRAGMVYVDPKNLKYEPYWKRWKKTRPLYEQETLNDFYEKLIPPTIDFILEGIDGTQQGNPLKQVIHQTDLNMVVQFCNTYEAIFQLKNEEGENIEYKKDALECGFIECVYLSLGASILECDRPIFDEFIKRSSGFMLVEDTIEKPAEGGQLPISKALLYDYFFDIIKLQWICWEWNVPKYKHDHNANFCDILVPTIDTMRTDKILNLMSQIRRPSLLIGETGTSKTAIITNYLKKLNPNTFIMLNINFSSRTSSIDVQRTIEGSVEKRTKDTFGPPLGKKITVFIDDMNMPQVDAYGTQQPIALLKLLFEYGGMYDRIKDLNWKKIKDLTFYAAMGCPGGGRNEVDSRFISMFSTYNLVFPNDDALRMIYSSIFKGHLEKFPPVLLSISDTLVEMTLSLFKIVIVELPPTPSKFHYIFNLKDLSRIFSGLLLIHPKYFKDPSSLVRVWRNEFIRVICDRLISDNDIKLMKNQIEKQIKMQFPPTFEADKGIQMKKIPPRPGAPRKRLDKDEKTSCGSSQDEGEFITMAEYALRDPILFGDYRNAVNESDERYYEDLLDYKAIYFLFQEILEEYKERVEKLNIVLFEDCLEHLTRVHRALRMHRGHVLLIGIGGVGKRAITKLAGFAAECQNFEITVSRGYNEQSFREDVKSLYIKVGVEQKKVVFFFTGSQVIEEGFLELINNILTVGSVPALFNDEEKDNIIGNCRTVCESAGLSPAKDSVWSYFLNNCAQNLHVVLSMSPAGDSLRNYCRNFPGLIGSTSIDWVFPWPTQALFAVAELYLSEHPMIGEAHRLSIVEHVVHVHSSIGFYTSDYLQKLRRRNFVTPKHYLDYINTYIKLMEEKNSSITAQCNRLQDGIMKIDEASAQIDILSAIVAEQQKNVSIASEKCELMIIDIDKSTQSANTKKEEASIQSKDVENKGKIIAVEKKEAEEALAEGLPALEAAREALADLDKSDITEIRSFATPPEPVQIVCECVAILKGYKEINWKTAKSMMAESNFLRSLLEMNAEILTSKQISECRKHMKLSTKLDEMQSISKAGYGLLKFVKAVLGFYDVYREVKPKKDKVEYLIAENDLQIKTLENLNTEIRNLEEKIISLNAQYTEAIKEKDVLMEMMKEAERRLVASNKLLSGLTSEKTRWEIELENLYKDQNQLIGECLICASFLSYTGAFSWEYRKTMLFSDWLNDLLERNIPIQMPFKINNSLTTDVEISSWSSQGLPPDELSIQNGILTLRASRFPLCIDPQLQALTWIKKHEAKNNLKILSFNDTDFTKQLEISITYGGPVLFQDVDDYIDPVINNILQKNILYQAGRNFVVVGDKEIDYDKNFRMYLTTKFSNPIFNPSVYAQAMVINYAVTQTGLEDQLLSVVVRAERPDLEQQREELIEQTSLNKQLLSNLEDSLLRELATSAGNMLDNVELIETLEHTKTKAFAVHEQLELASNTSKDIEKLRDGYRPAARRGAILFFALSDMSTVNSMYQYALNAYLDIFSFSLKKSIPDSMLYKRLENIIGTLTENVYCYGCTGIFERHKLLFSFQIATKLEINEERMKQNELEFFIKGNLVLSKSERKCPSKWLTDTNWSDILKLSSDFPDPFKTLPENIEENINEWKMWFDLENPEDYPCPGDFNVICNEFQKLMFMRCFRVDRIYRCVNNYINGLMGEHYVTPPVISLVAIFEQTNCTMPVCFILSPGSDPTNELMKLAENYGGGIGNFRYISLGQGQEKKAFELLDAAISSGYWLMLQNGHLLIPFIRSLEKYLEKVENPHPKFRLWITTDPTSTFPIGILQKSLKVVTESPNGLKLNLRSTFFKLKQETLDSCTHSTFKPLVYTLAFFHAVVQERRKYDKIGWNISYDFNESDFDVCVQILGCYLGKVIGKQKIPWNSLKYLIGEVMYGGRVIDDFDRRIVQAYMNEYMGDFLFDVFQPYHFYHDDNVDYFVPLKAKEKQDFIAHIEKLPMINKPDVFGLHPNAEIGYYTQTVKDMWTNLIELQPQTDTGMGGVSRDEFIDDIAQNILKKLPPQFQVWRIKKALAVNLQPTGVVLIQELERFNLLLERIKKTLDLLRKAISGEIGMDNVLDNISNSLFNGHLPNDWRKLAPATRKILGTWVEHLLKRATQYKFWASSGEPMVIWLSGLHIPESYLTALVQIACRKNAWPLDRSTLFTNVTENIDPDDVEERPPTGCYIHGLFIEGARFDLKTMQLARSLPKVLVEDLPILSVTPIEAHRLKLTNTYRSPVYTTSLRRNAMGEGFVFEADLATSEHVSHWILQGVCLTLNAD